MPLQPITELEKTHDPGIIQILKEAHFTPKYGECVGNSLIASLVYFRKTGEPTKLYNVVFSENRASQTYLVINDKPYSKDVTWPNAEFPELDLASIKRMKNSGDISTQLALYAWMNSSGRNVFFDIINTYPNQIIRPKVKFNFSPSVLNPDDAKKGWEKLMLKYANACVERDGHGDLMKIIMEQQGITI